MRRLIWLAIAVLAGLAGGCADHSYAPFSFKDFPGYAPAGPTVPAHPRYTPGGIAY